MMYSTQNLVMVASDLLDMDNIQLWLDLNQVAMQCTNPVVSEYIFSFFCLQTTAAEHITELFGALEMLAQGVFLQDPAQMDTSIVGDNIAIVVMRPDCESRNQSITISSNTLDSNSQNGEESTLVLPVSVFGDSLEEACRDVGVIAIVYGGAGPDLISLQDEFIPKSNCTPTPAPKVHGRWLVVYLYHLIRVCRQQSHQLYIHPWHGNDFLHFGMSVSECFKL